ncbi:MAG: hypothetical protein GC189_03260 [Alphaproteobacteria bacterium]|nr:hypothetical protein [Alphaproteobacteria bacterium]
MRSCLVALLALAACSGHAAHAYPEAERTAFAQSCSGSEEFCACAWDGLTRAMTVDEYHAALTRFQDTGLMDPRIVRVRAQCREQTI